MQKHQQLVEATKLMKSPEPVPYKRFKPTDSTVSLNSNKELGCNMIDLIALYLYFTFIL